MVRERHAKHQRAAEDDDEQAEGGGEPTRGAAGAEEKRERDLGALVNGLSTGKSGQWSAGLFGVNPWSAGPYAGCGGGGGGSSSRSSCSTRKVVVVVE